MMRSPVLAAPPNRNSARHRARHLAPGILARPNRRNLWAGFGAQALLVLGAGHLMERRGLLGVEPLARLVASDVARRSDDTVTAAVAGLGLVGLALGFITMLATAAVIADSPRAKRVLRPFVLPFARRLATGAVVVTLAGTTVATPAVGPTAAAGATTGEVIGPSDPVVRTPFTSPVAVEEPVVRAPAATTTTQASTAPRPTAPTSPPSAPPAEAPTLHHEVRAGEHLWGIARNYLHFLTGIPPHRDEVATYWARVVAVNRERVRSGDPNLIFPGEVVTLPWPATLDPRVGRFDGS